MSPGGASAITVFTTGANIDDAAFRNIVDALPAAVYTTDAQGRLTYFNDAAVKLSGRVPELGTDHWCVTWKMFRPDGTPLPHEACPMAEALKGAEVSPGVECMAERPDGTRFWFTPYPAVVRDSEGRIVGGINLLVDITARKNAEIEASEQFRTIIDTTPECIKIVAPDGTLLFMNPPGLKLIEAAAGEVFGKSIYEVIAPQDRERFRELNERVCRGEKASMQFDIVGLKGTLRHMETHAAPLRHVDGTTVNLAITRDITVRKRAEQDALLLAAIVDSSDDAIISKNLNGVITSWNKSAERLFGYSAPEAVGKTVAELLIPDDRQDEEPNILARLRRGERVDHFETVRRRKDGSLLDISLTISPVKDSAGRVIGASKIARDITPRKRAEDALRDSEERLRLAQQAAKIGVFEWDIQSGQNTWTRELEELYGLLPGTFGKTQSAWEDLVHPADRADALARVEQAFQTGTPVEAEWRVIWPDGSVHWLAGRFQVYRDAAGQPLRLSGVNFEITERKSIEHELRRANTDLEQFAYSASHDLQEPLRTINIYSELISKRYADSLDDDAKKFIGYLRVAATRMEALVRDLLSYTLVTRMEKREDAADAQAALQVVLANLSGAIAEAGAKVTSGPLPAVAMHETHLQQLLQNLISNAIKYRSPDRPPVVHIQAERQNEYWTFAVTDNGIGVDKEYRETIFGLFKRLHTADEYSGTGIGLAICKRIVERYHGRIWVESEPGRGSTFRLALPA